MSRLAIITMMLALLVPPAYAMGGMIALPSMHTAKASMDKLEAIAKARDLKIFARIDHAAGARSINQALRPTELLIFGHPKGGTPLLQYSQSYGLELPLRVLAWEDAQGKSWLGYKEPGTPWSRKQPASRAQIYHGFSCRFHQDEGCRG